MITRVQLDVSIVTRHEADNHDAMIDVIRGIADAATLSDAISSVSVNNNHDGRNVLLVEGRA